MESKMSFADVTNKTLSKVESNVPNGFVVLKRGNDYKSYHNNNRCTEIPVLHPQVTQTTEESIRHDLVNSELYEIIQGVCQEFKEETLLSDNPMIVEDLSQHVWKLLRSHITIETHDTENNTDEYDDNESTLSLSD